MFKLLERKKEKEKKDGLVSEPNLGYILRSVGQNPTDAQVKEFFVKYSKADKPGVDLEGTIKAGGDMFEAMAGVDHAKALEEAFTVFDQKAQDTGALTGNVSSSEVRHIISNLGIDGLAEEELDEMIAEVDPDGSGVINYKEFVKRIFAPIPPVSAA